MVDVAAKIGVREGYPAVDDHDAIVGLDGHAVHADLAEPAEGYKSDRRIRIG
jgi:hypothetical protein